MRIRFLAAAACGCVVAVTPAALPAVAGASATTQATVFQAFTSAGKPAFKTHTEKGYCWTGSIAADRSDAWRCFVGDLIYDPCFSSSADPGYVACPYVSLRKGILVKLTKKLPHKFANHHKASVSDRPWLIETASGRRWLFATGATAVIGGRRANYFRSGSTAALWGLPNRHLEPWKIYWAPLSARRLTKRVGIRHAWM
jgi:hypothetical protein